MTCGTSRAPRLCSHSFEPNSFRSTCSPPSASGGTDGGDVSDLARVLAALDEEDPRCGHVHVLLQPPAVLGDGEGEAVAVSSTRDGEAEGAAEAVGLILVLVGLAGGGEEGQEGCAAREA
eukprot:748972-Hanusia_phi.AAC.2